MKMLPGACFFHTRQVNLTWINQKKQRTINKTQIISKILKVQNSNYRPINSILFIWYLGICICFLFVFCVLTFVISVKKTSISKIRD